MRGIEPYPARSPAEEDMKLKTVNKWLRRIGLLLVVEIDWESRCEGKDPSPTRLWLDTARGYRTRCLNEKYETYWEEHGPRPSERLQSAER